MDIIQPYLQCQIKMIEQNWCFCLILVQHVWLISFLYFLIKTHWSHEPKWWDDQMRGHHYKPESGHLLNSRLTNFSWWENTDMFFWPYFQLPVSFTITGLNPSQHKIQSRKWSLKLKTFERFIFQNYVVLQQPDSSMFLGYLAQQFAYTLFQTQKNTFKKY